MPQISEIESVVRVCANELSITLNRLQVVHDKQRGYLVRMRVTESMRALVTMLGRYAFAVEAKKKRYCVHETQHPPTLPGFRVQTWLECRSPVQRGLAIH